MARLPEMKLGCWCAGLALVLGGCTSGIRRQPVPAAPVASAARDAAADSRWQRVDTAVEAAIRAGKIPGCVLVVRHRGRTVYEKAFGARSLQPARSPLATDTVFDLASLTKVVATTSAVMLLVQEGKLDLDAPVARYWPEFGQQGKATVTLRHLLTHTAGLPPWADYARKYEDPQGPAVQDRRADVLREVAAAPLRSRPGTRQDYSDLGFITLGELVHRVSGSPLDRFVVERIFAPLGMTETTFNPGQALCARAAPTTRRGGTFRCGQVHDPNAAVSGGVSGHAGLFSTAADLTRFTDMLLSSDASGSTSYPLSRETIRMMTTPQTPPELPMRGLGWDVASPLSKVRGQRMPLGSFGHTGFTGTYLWLDPYSQTAIIGLSSRLHPDEHGNARPLWAAVADLVAEITAEPDASGPLPRRNLVEGTPTVLTGLDVLRREQFRRLQGRRIGLITNQTGVTRDGIREIDLLREARGVRLRALFSPEHGLSGQVDREVTTSADARTGLPLYSLYGDGRRKPTRKQLEGLDTLVFDLQDVGLRYYTYISTLGLCMEAARENGLRVIVLDRPNPNNGITVDGPLLEPACRSFIGRYRLPVRNGLTVGELARLYNQEFGIACDLEVVPMEGWRREMGFEETGLPWIPPSPNLRTARQAELYTAVGLLEAANVSVGRGTETPFEVIGAPWIDGERLAAELREKQLPGVSFRPTTFTPVGNRYAGRRCSGVRLELTDRGAFAGCRIALEIMEVLERRYGAEAGLSATSRHWGTDRLRQGLVRRIPVSELLASFAGDLAAFESTRKQYLLYQ